MVNSSLEVFKKYSDISKKQRSIIKTLYDNFKPVPQHILADRSLFSMLNCDKTLKEISDLENNKIIKRIADIEAPEYVLTPLGSKIYEFNKDFDEKVLDAYFKSKVKLSSKISATINLLINPRKILEDQYFIDCLEDLLNKESTDKVILYPNSTAYKAYLERNSNSCSKYTERI